ncbi:MAG: DNA alkylation repair protein [Methanosarcina sp.]
MLRQMAKKLSKAHALALEIWNLDIYEALVLACLVENPALVSEEWAEGWINEFNSWDLCDHSTVFLVFFSYF